jgi:serine/threonine protein kinase
METFNHKYIVKMFDSMVDTRYIYIIQEYCNGGNLLEYIHKHGRLSEQTCKQLLQQLATALKYMRSFNISHLDLKPDNIFLIKSETITIKLGGLYFIFTIIIIIIINNYCYYNDITRIVL